MKRAGREKAKQPNGRDREGREERNGRFPRDTTLYYAYDRFAVNSRLHFQRYCRISF